MVIPEVIQENTEQKKKSRNGEKMSYNAIQEKAQELNLLTQNEMDNIEKDVIAEITDAENLH